MGTRLHYFDWLKSRPRHEAAFKSVMSIPQVKGSEEWFDFYPVEDKLRVVGSQILLVDIGGALGHNLVAFHERFPNLPGRLVVQDLVLDGAEKLPYGIEAIKYDFFTQQPIKDAKVYYLRTVLRDWPDNQAQEILSNVRGAMNQDSILLIHEHALPESNVPLYRAEVDLHMMAIFSSMDRTSAQFNVLLELSGFDVVDVWTPKTMVSGPGTLFEAVLKH